VSRAGGGSTFDGLEKDGSTEEMNVLRRYRQYEDDPDYRKVASVTDIVDLNWKLFGMDPFKQVKECHRHRK